MVKFQFTRVTDIVRCETPCNEKKKKKPSVNAVVSGSSVK